MKPISTPFLTACDNLILQKTRQTNRTTLVTTLANTFWHQLQLQCILVSHSPSSFVEFRQVDALLIDDQIPSDNEFVQTNQIGNNRNQQVNAERQ